MSLGKLMSNNIAIIEISKSQHISSVFSINETMKKTKKYGKYVYNIFLDKKKRKTVKKLFKEQNYFSILKYIIFCRTYDYTIINTLNPRYTMIYFIISLISRNCILYIRNVNAWIKPKKKEFIPFIVHRLRYIIYKRAYAVIVANIEIKNYLLRQSNKKVYVIPFQYPKKQSKYKFVNNDKIKIVIPGIISNKRRNYWFILNLIKMLEAKNEDIFEFYLLGKVGNESDDYKVFKEFKNKKNIHVYDKTLEEDYFRNILVDSDILLSCIKERYSDRFSDEIYGLTKDTGIIGNMIFSKKPLLLNNNILVEESLNDAIIEYKNLEELYNILIKYRSKNLLRKLQRQAINCIEKYNPDYFASFIDKET